MTTAELREIGERVNAWKYGSVAGNDSPADDRARLYEALVGLIDHCIDYDGEHWYGPPYCIAEGEATVYDTKDAAIDALLKEQIL